MRHLIEGDVGLSLYLGLLFLPFSSLHFTSTPVSTIQNSDSCFPPDTHTKYSKNKREEGTLLISSITICSSSTFTIWQWIITTLRGLFFPLYTLEKSHFPVSFRWPHSPLSIPLLPVPVMYLCWCLMHSRFQQFLPYSLWYMCFWFV